MLGRIGFSPIISEYMNPPTPGRHTFGPIALVKKSHAITESIWPLMNVRQGVTTHLWERGGSDPGRVRM